MGKNIWVDIPDQLQKHEDKAKNIVLFYNGGFSLQGTSQGMTFFFYQRYVNCIYLEKISLAE